VAGSIRGRRFFDLMDIWQFMMKKMFLTAGIFSAAMLTAGVAQAQTLPHVQMTKTFSAFTPRLPVWMSEAPDGSGRMFVVQQEGLIQIVRKGSDGSEHIDFLDIRDRKPHLETGGQLSNEEGLLSMAFHPGFKTNGLFYIYYNQHAPSRQSVISEFKVSETNKDQVDLSSERILLTVPQPYSNHKGGELLFGPDGYLYFGLGDGGLGDDPSGNGQNTATFLAKMLRIDVNTRGTTPARNGRPGRPMPYAIPSDNPFVDWTLLGAMPIKKEIYAYGLRNPWRFSFDKQTGDLWVGDVGQDLWEEVDLIVKGGNYGWSVREATHQFKPGPAGAQYIEPVMEYPHRPNLLSQSMYPDHTIGSCIIGGYVYRGKKYPSLQGVYLYADYTLGTIWGFRYENGKVTQQGTLLSQPKNISSFAEDQDGELYVLTLDANGGGGSIYSLSVP
jgi:glucose/arabinose dehydrogenase